MVEFEKLNVLATYRETATSPLFSGKILRQTTRASARNHQVFASIQEVLFYITCQHVRQVYYKCLTIHFFSRHQYYLTLKNYIHDSKLDLSALQTKTVARICALIAQIEYGDYNQERLSRYSVYLPSDICNLYSNTSDLQKDAAAEHSKLLNSSTSEVKIEFLNTMSNVPGYGIELFRGKTNEDKEAKRVEICVGSDGVRVYGVEREFDMKQRKDVIRKVLEKR